MLALAAGAIGERDEQKRVRQSEQGQVRAVWEEIAMDIGADPVAAWSRRHRGEVQRRRSVPRVGRARVAHGRPTAE